MDTGSQITAMSQTLFDYLDKYYKVHTLPVSNLVIVTAVGKKATTVKKQVLLDIQLGSLVIQTRFVIIPYLTSQIIIGNDWMLNNGVIIDYDNVHFIVKKNLIPGNIIKFGEHVREKLEFSEVDDVTFVQVVNCHDDTLSELNVNNDNPVFKINENDVENVENVVQINKNTDQNANVTKVNGNVCIDMKLCNEINFDVIGSEENCELNDKCNEMIYFNDFCDNDLFDHEMEQIEMCALSNGEETNYLEELQQLTDSMTYLDDYQKTLFYNKLSRYEKLFTFKAQPAGKYQHRIRLKKPDAFVRKSYPIPFAYRDRVTLTIEKMLDLGIIERSESSFCNPLRIVEKKNGEIRLCLDARFLNDQVESDNESPPLISEIIQRFNGVQYFSTTDLTSGYWQIELSPESRQYTAFLGSDGTTLYQFKRIPFGLKTAGSGFMRALSITLGKQFDAFLIRYVDDLLIFSKSFAEHLDQICAIFDVLQDENYSLQFKKSFFLRSIVNFLGYEISIDGVRPHPDRLQVITHFEEPKDLNQLQSFFGLCNYYRQFVEKYSNYVEPFRDLLSNKKLWIWTSKHTAAFTDIKQKFVDVIKLDHIHPEYPFILQTDGSDKGIGGVLYQENPQKYKNVVTLVSRCLTPAEKNYTTTEIELLAIVYCVNQLRTYLLGRDFHILTDHKALTFLSSTPFLSQRLIRWNLILQQYSYTITHCIGRDNVVADFLSRNPEGQFGPDANPHELVISKLKSFTPIDNRTKKQHREFWLNLFQDQPEFIRDFRNIANLQKNDPEVKKLFSNATDEQSDSFSVYEDVLFRKDTALGKWQLVIPKNLTRKLIDMVHSSLGHPGTYKTFCYIREYYYWRGMRDTIKHFVVVCDLCQKVKHLNYSMQGTYKMVESKEPNDLVSVDYYGPLPKSVSAVRYIVAFLDVYTKHVKLYALKRATTTATLNRLLNDYLPLVGKPKRILSDHGTQFTSPKWSSALHKENITAVFSSVRHPQGNPVERVNRELGKFFRIFASHSHVSWARHLKQIEFLLNLTTHNSTGFAPVELHFGKKPIDQIRKIVNFPANVDLDHSTKLVLANERMSAQFDKRRSRQRSVSNVKLAVGDLVLVSVPHLSNADDRTVSKFFHIFQGPYRISKSFDNNAFELVDRESPSIVKGIYNCANLRRYYENASKVD